MIEASPLGRPTLFLLPVVFDTISFFLGLPFFFTGCFSLLKIYPLVILSILKYALVFTLIISLKLILKVFLSTLKALGYLYLFSILVIIAYY